MAAILRKMGSAAKGEDWRSSWIARSLVPRLRSFFALLGSFHDPEIAHPGHELRASVLDCGSPLPL